MVYRNWRLEYLGKPIIDEFEYYTAQLAAERLLVQGLIDYQDFLLMVQDSNLALERFRGEIN